MYNTKYARYITWLHFRTIIHFRVKCKFWGAACMCEGMLIVLSLTRKEKSYGDQTRNLFSTLHTKLNTLLGLLLWLLQATQKKFRRLPVQPGLRSSKDLRFGRKMATFQLFFQSREQVVVRQGQIRRIGWVIKTLEAQVGQFLLGCKCPVSIPWRFCFKMSFNCTSRDE